MNKKKDVGDLLCEIHDLAEQIKEDMKKGTAKWDLLKIKKPRLKVKPPKVIAHNKTYNRKKLKKLDKKEKL